MPRSEQPFYSVVLRKLLADGTLSIGSPILVVCGGPFDRDMLHEIGFSNARITNLDEARSAVAPFAWSHEDAEKLSFADESFDFVLVHAGLHHCGSPHRGLLEMYRVAKRGIVVFESRDSLAIRLAVKLGLTSDYEEFAVLDHAGVSGGVRNSATPNYVYRWTEHEVQKTIRSAAPQFEPNIRFFYGLFIPFERFNRSGQSGFAVLLGLAAPMLRLASRLLPKQCNRFAFYIEKSAKRRPWISRPENSATLEAK